MAGQRTVRFAEGVPDESLYPPPVFSPTQLDESVLHNIWSPTAMARARGAQNPSNSERPTHSATGAGQLADSAATTKTTPSPRSHQQVAENGRRSPTTTIVSNDVFYSPASSLDMTSPRSVVSGKSQKSCSSFGTLRDVTLLDLDNIKKCNSVGDLENVIQVLNGEGKFQALLRMAKSRLAAIVGNAGGLGYQPSQTETKPPASTRFFAAPETTSFFPPKTEVENETRISNTRTAPFFQVQSGKSSVFRHREQQQTTAAPLINTSPSIQDSPLAQERRSPSILNRINSYPVPRVPEQQTGASHEPANIRQIPLKPSPKSLARSPSHPTIEIPPAIHNLTSTSSRQKESSSPPNAHFGIQIESPRSASQNISSSSGRGLEGLNHTEESSLVMSVSTSVLEENLEDMNFAGPSNPQSALTLANSRNFAPMNVDTKRLSSTYGYLSPSPGSSRQNRALSDDIKKLTETVMCMESSRAADRKMFLEKLASLEANNHNADEKIKVVETMMEQSTEATRNLLTSLQQLRAESNELQANVRAEREAWSKSYQEAKERESRFCQKAEELTKLMSSSSPSSVSSAGTESDSKVRKQYEALLHLKQKENEQLASDLRETLGNLLVGLGRNKNEVRGMTRDQQRELVTSFSQKSLSTKAATEALAREIATLEKERQTASAKTQEVSAELEKSQRVQVHLERENKQLNNKIHELSQELTKLQNYMTEISSSHMPREDWSKQEQKYKDIIQNLQSQLRKEETMVSVGLYKAATESAKHKETEARTKQFELNTMLRKYTNLEKRLLENEKKHSNTLATSLQLQAEKKETDKRIEQLTSQLKEERQNSRIAVETAKQETAKLRNQMEDMKFELQENGGKLMTKSPMRNIAPLAGAKAPRNISPSPRNRLLVASTPTPTSSKNLSADSLTPTPMKKTTSSSSTSKSAGATSQNKENNAVRPAPRVGGKQPLSKFSFVVKNGGRKGLREKVQQMRSPKARHAVKM